GRDGAVGAIIERDLLGIALSPSELGRAAFLGFLLVLYTAFIVVAPLGAAAATPETIARLLLFDVVAAGYFLTAFGLRFVFPAMSLEVRAAWLFFSSPIPLFRVCLAYVALMGWVARRAALAAAAGGSAFGWALGAVPLSAGLGAAAVALAYWRIRALEAA